MEIRTFTNFWSADMKLHSINDMALPYPISLRVLTSFIVTAIPWWVLLNFFNVPLEAPWHVLWVAVPGVLAWLSSGNYFEKKSLLQYLKSRIGYMMEERKYKGLEKDLNKYDTETEVKINAILPFKSSEGD